MPLSSYITATMFIRMPLGLWHVLNSALFVATLALAMGIGLRCRDVNRSFGSAMLSVAVFCLVIAITYIGGYAIATAFFAEWMAWIPLFYRDYTHHGFTSVKDFLAANDNFLQLIILQGFSFAISSIIYFVAGTVGYVAQPSLAQLRQALGRESA